jgi:hypothetical protein
VIDLGLDAEVVAPQLERAQDVRETPISVL